MAEGVCNLTLTSALDGAVNASANLPAGKSRVPLYKRLDGARSQFGAVQKISPPPGFDPWAVQPVANRFINYASPAAKFNLTIF
jgi:hypothetical protein